MLKWEARSGLMILVASIALGVKNNIPILGYILGSFPTYHHRLESAILLAMLTSSMLVISTTTQKPLQKYALISILFLFEYSALKLGIRFFQPIKDAPLIWLISNISITAMLATISVTAIIRNIITKEEITTSLIVFILTLSYLYT